MMVDIKSVYHIFVTKKNHALMKWAKKRILNADNFSHGVRYRINTEKMEIEQNLASTAKKEVPVLLSVYL